MSELPFIIKSSQTLSLTGYYQSYPVITLDSTSITADDINLSSDKVLKDFVRYIDDYSIFTFNKNLNEVVNTSTAIRFDSDKQLTDTFFLESTISISSSTYLTSSTDGAYTELSVGWSGAYFDTINIGEESLYFNLGLNYSDSVTVDSALAKQVGVKLEDDSVEALAELTLSSVLGLQSSQEILDQFLLTKLILLTDNVLIDDLLGINDGITYSAGKSLLDSFTLSDAFNLDAAFERAFDDSVSTLSQFSYQASTQLDEISVVINDPYTLNTGKVFEDTATASSENLVYSAGLVYNDDVTVNELLTYIFSTSFSDTVIADSSTALNSTLNKIDDVTASTAIPIMDMSKVLNDTATMSSEFFIGYLHTLTDSTSVDSSINYFNITKSLTDSVSASVDQFYKQINSSYNDTIDADDAGLIYSQSYFAEDYVNKEVYVADSYELF